jgi:hypothetical protein
MLLTAVLYPGVQDGLEAATTVHPTGPWTFDLK